MAAAALLLHALGCSDKAPTAVPTAVIVVLSEPTIPLGMTTSAVARVPYGQRMPAGALRWSSSSPDVATVSADGVVTALGLGVTRITASADGTSGSAMLRVIPRPVASLTISPETASVYLGSPLQLEAIPRSVDGFSLPDRLVRWTTTDTSIAPVDAFGRVTTGSRFGQVVITAESEGKRATAVIKVISHAVSISISPSRYDMIVGDTVQIWPSLRSVDGSGVSGPWPTWSTSDSTKALVNYAGLVTAVAPGTVVITATSEGRSASAVVTVVHSGTWSSIPDMPDARECHSAVAFDGKIFVFGGTKAEGPITSLRYDNQYRTVFVFDPSSNRWSERAPMPAARTCAAAAVVGDRIYIVGGFTGAPLGLAGPTLIYDPASDSWSSTGGLQIRRSSLAVAYVGKKLLAIGGTDAKGQLLKSVEYYDPTVGSWRIADGELRRARSSLGAATISEDAVLVVGGWAGIDPATGVSFQDLDVEELHPSTGTTILGAPLRHHRYAHAVAELSGSVYAFSGDPYNFKGPSPLNDRDVERYDPTFGRWLPVAPMQRNRRNVVAVALGGRIYVLGGTQNAGVIWCRTECPIVTFASVEVFTP